jgi:hypothetical protein
MSDKDVELLKKGSYVLLPNDEHGRAVVCYNKSLLDNVQYDRESLVSIFRFEFVHSPRWIGMVFMSF